MFHDRADPEAKAWETLRQILQQWEFTSNYAVVVGDARGRLFTYEGGGLASVHPCSIGCTSCHLRSATFGPGNFTLKTKIPTGSTSKWPSAMMFAGLVHDGTIKSLDDPVNQYLSWWTKDPSDLRSTVPGIRLCSQSWGQTQN